MQAITMSSTTASENEMLLQSFVVLNVACNTTNGLLAETEHYAYTTVVAPVAGTATPLFGPAVLAPVTPLRYVKASLSSGMVPITRINKQFMIEMSRSPAKRVSALLLSESRRIWFQPAQHRASANSNNSSD